MRPIELVQAHLVCVLRTKVNLMSTGGQQVVVHLNGHPDFSLPRRPVSGTRLTAVCRHFRCGYCICRVSGGLCSCQMEKATREELQLSVRVQSVVQQIVSQPFT